MKHLTFANRSLLIGDDMADAVMEFAAQLASAGEARSVEFLAYSDSGEKVTATLLLGAGAPVMAETSSTDLAEPDNSLVLNMLLGEIQVRLDPPNARMLDSAAGGDEDDGYPG